VTFTPRGLGARSAAIFVNDDATGSPQIVALNGTTPDFSMSVGSTATATVSPGQTATYTISVSPSGGFNQSVTFTCSGVPPPTTCTVSPNPILLNGTSAVMATVTITTTAPSHGFALPFGFDARWKMNHWSRSFLLELLGMIIVVSLLVWHRNRRLRWAPLVTLTVLLWMGITMTACGGGSLPSGGSRGTQAGTYTITVSGSPASGLSTAAHTATLTLVVQ
jgi:hypothetical protein